MGLKGETVDQDKRLKGLLLTATGQILDAHTFLTPCCSDAVIFTPQMPAIHVD